MAKLGSSARTVVSGEMMEDIKQHVREEIRREALQHGEIDVVGLFKKQCPGVTINTSSALNYKQFKKMMVGFKVQLPETAMKKLFKEFDQVGTGRISFQAFRTFVELLPGEVDDIAERIRAEVRRRGVQYIRQSFSRMDKDGDGDVRVAEFGGFVEEQLHIKLSDSELTRLVTRIDPKVREFRRTIMGGLAVEV